MAVFLFDCHADVPARRGSSIIGDVARAAACDSTASSCRRTNASIRDRPRINPFAWSAAAAGRGVETPASAPKRPFDFGLAGLRSG